MKRKRCAVRRVSKHTHIVPRADTEVTLGQIDGNAAELGLRWMQGLSSERV